MSVGFGFSAGDFIAALELVTTVVNALRESGGSSAEYRSLVSQLNTLQTTLLRVKRLELEDNQHAELIALQQAASQCQRTIDAFWEKIKKYQTSLSIGGSGSRVKDTWRKVKWAIVKKEDLVRFKADLMGHTESIELLLTTVQMYGPLSRKLAETLMTTGQQRGYKIKETTKIIKVWWERFKIHISDACRD